MLKPSSQQANKYVLKAFHIREYLYVNEDWILPSPLLTTLPLTYNL